jgi:O-antigen ligase
MNRQRFLTFFKAISYIGVYGGLLMPLVFIPVVIFPFVFSKLIAFQVLIGLVFPSYLALAWMEPKYRPPRSLLYGAIVAYFVALLLSTVFSVDPIRSWWGNQERMNGLFTLLHLFAWLTMTIGLLKTWTDWRRLLNYEIGLSVFMAIVALLQIPFPNLLMFQAGARVGGLLDNPIYMGSYQIFNLFFLALLFLKTDSRRARMLYGVAAIVDLIAFFAAQSRGALIGLAAGIAVFALFYALFTKERRIKWFILGGACTAAGLYALAFAFRETAFVKAIPFMARLTDFSASVGTRFIAWKIAWKGFLERPITGWGFDTFQVLFNTHYNPESLRYGYYETWFDRAHNTILDVLAMTGIVGFVTYAAIFMTLFYLVWRAWKKTWIDLPVAAVLVALPVAYFLQNLFVFDHPAAFSMSYLMFGLVIAATRGEFVGAKESAAPIVHHAEGKSAPTAFYVVLQLVFLVIVWLFSIQPFRASMISIRANSIARGPTLERSWELMREAGNIPTPYLDEQTFLISRDLISAADSGSFGQLKTGIQTYDYVKQLLEQHLADHPRDTHQLFIYARMMQSILPVLPQDRVAAEAALAVMRYQKAIESSPKRQQLHFGLARLYGLLGKKQEAMDALLIAANLDPEVGEGWWYVGITQWYDFNKPDEGASTVLRAMKVKAPYGLHNVREATVVSQAAVMKGDRDVMKMLITKLPNLPGGTQDFYLGIATDMEKLGLLEERNRILNALSQLDPTVLPKLEALKNGTATSIQESIALGTPVITGATLIDDKGNTMEVTPIPVNTPESAPSDSAAPRGPRAGS